MKTAPVQGGPCIPWALHEEAFAVYAEKYGHGQSAERLAERGGFGAGELDDFVPGWRDRHAAIVEMVEAAQREGRAEGRRQAYEMSARLLRQSAKNIQQACPTHDATIALLNEHADTIESFFGRDGSECEEPTR
jgi:hypothetical protein